MMLMTTMPYPYMIIMCFRVTTVRRNYLNLLSAKETTHIMHFTTDPQPLIKLSFANYIAFLLDAAKFCGEFEES
jgi:hypothetical protein